MVDNKQTKFIIWTAFLYLTLVWGSTFILNKRTLVTFTAIQTASLRLTFAMSAMIWFVKPHFALLPKEKRFHLLLSALTGICIPAYCFALAQMGLPSAMTGVLNALTPCMAFILGIIFFQQSASWLKIAGLALGFVGSAMIILVNAKGELSLNSHALWVILATILYGFNLNWVKKHLAEVPALPLATLSVTVAGAVGFCILLTTNWLETMQANPAGATSFAAIATLGIFGTAVAQFFFSRMLQLSSALFAGSITYFIPIVAVGWGLYDGEVLTWVHCLGILCIIGGILIIRRFK